VDNRSRTLERPDIKFVVRAVSVEAHTHFDRPSKLLLEPARAPQMDPEMTPALVAVCEMSEFEQAFLLDAAHLIAVERTTRACRERGWV
jgi:hypothetical protein